MDDGSTVLNAAAGSSTTLHTARRGTIHPALRSTLALIIALGSLTATAPVYAAEQEAVEFDGAGWGHGIGMSQWGAYAQAKGWQLPAPRTYDQILAHYYPGTSRESYDAASPGHPRLKVNLEGDRTDLTLRVIRNGGAVQEPATVMRGTEIIGLLTGQSIRIVWLGADRCTAEFKDGADPLADWPEGSCDFDIVWDGDTEDTPTTVIEIAGCTLFDWNARSSKPCRYGRGSLQTLDNSGRDSDPGFDLVLDIDIDAYVLGISEVSYAWPVEALKAQAVASRSYAAEAIDRLNPSIRPCGCDVLDTSADQRYVGWGHGWTRWIDAAKATDNEVLTHPAAPRNDVIAAFYSSSNGGATEARHEKWGGSPTPWLPSVDDPYSLHPDNVHSSWTKSISAEALTAKVWGAGAPNLTSVKVVARNTSGSAKTVEFFSASDDRTTTRSAAWVTSQVGLRSWYFDVDYTFGPTPPPPQGFSDIGETIHRKDIEYLAELGIALSCADGPDRYCPDDPMRREDIAAFLARALDLPAVGTDFFVDDNGLTFEADINRIAAVGITRGCNPPANDRFCPDDTVTRGQMAAFLVRAWKLTDPGPGDWFVDDDRSVFEGDIDRLATAGITRGCNPPSNDRYCPTRLVTRAETASFIARALRDL